MRQIGQGDSILSLGNFADADELKNYPTSITNHGDSCFLDDVKFEYVYDNNAVEVEDLPNIIVPNSGGAWYKKNGIGLGPGGVLGDFYNSLSKSYHPLQNSEISGFISSGYLVPKQKYKIIDPDQGGYIIMTANSRNSFDLKSSWVVNKGLQGIGYIEVITGNIGQINSIIDDNSTELLDNVLIFPDQTIDQISTSIATSINNNSINSGYGAVAILNVVAIYTIAETGVNNGFDFTIDSSGDLTFNTKQISRGLVPSQIILEIEYDYLNDKIQSAYDKIYNNLVTCNFTLSSILTYSPIDLFRWRDDSFKNNIIIESSFRNVFIFEDNMFQYNEIRNSEWTNFLYSSNQGVQHNKVIRSSQVNNNYLISTSCNFNYNTLDSSYIVQNRVFEDGSAISSNNLNLQAQIFQNLISGGYILQNDLTGLNASISSNILGEATANIYQNSLIGLSAAINNNNLLNGGSITSNTFNGNVNIINGNSFSHTSQKIQRNIISGNNARISSNTFDTDENQEISANVLIGIQSKIDSNFLSGDSCKINNNIFTGSNTSITANTIVGDNSEISDNQFIGKSNTIDSNQLPSANSLISCNILSGENCTINNNILNSSSASYIINNQLKNYANGINGQNFGSNGIFIREIILDTPQYILWSITFDSSVDRVEKFSYINYDADFKFRRTLDGTTNFGEIGVTILGIVPEKFYSYLHTSDGPNLTSSTDTANMSIGYNVDPGDAIFTNAIITSYVTSKAGFPTSPVKTTAQRYVQLTITTEDVSGTIDLNLKGRFGL